MKIRLIDGARHFWRQASTWVAGVALTIQGFMIVDAGQILANLGLIPPHLRGAIPTPVFQGIQTVLFLLTMIGVLARQVKQPKLQQKIETTIEAKKENHDGVA